ncbi:MAG: hypothetical protein WBY94_02490 [Polyangiaceae bacterium]
MFSVDAPRIAARHEEKGRRAIDDEAPNVLRLRPCDTRSLLDFEPKTPEVGHLVTQSGSNVFAPSSLRKAGCRGAVLAIVHHFRHKQRSTRGASCPRAEGAGAARPEAPSSGACVLALPPLSSQFREDRLHPFQARQARASFFADGNVLS